MTDLLGVCLSWGDESCTIQPASGPPVVVPLSDIVSGKPVPPRASVRQRVPARDTERHSAPLWPGVERVALGEWELRSDPAPVGRLVKRANSCLAFGDPGVALPEAAGLVRAFYAGRGRTALVQVELDSPTEQGLTELGWTVVRRGDAHLMLTSVAMASRGLGGDDEVLLEEDGPRVRVVRRSGTAEVGTGRAALDGDWLGVHDLRVAPEHRGRGHARALMAAILAWGAERGAATVWLHVETDNLPALSLYDGLGFLTHHTCRYLAGPPELPR